MNARVVLVSDLLLVRAGFRRVVQDAGVFVIGEAANCTDGAALAAREPRAVVLLDLEGLPDAIGCIDTLVGRVGSRVIAVSERRGIMHHAAAVDHGAVGLVLKNEPAETLLKAIAKVDAGEVWLDRHATADALTRLAQRRHAEQAEAAKIASLTPREHDILGLIGEGLKNAAVAERLSIRESTARNHVTSILGKLAVADRFELVVYAFKHGLIPCPHLLRPYTPPKEDT